MTRYNELFFKQPIFELAFFPMEPFSGFQLAFAVTSMMRIFFRSLPCFSFTTSTSSSCESDAINYIIEKQGSSILALCFVLLLAACVWPNLLNLFQSESERGHTYRISIRMLHAFLENILKLKLEKNLQIFELIQRHKCHSCNSKSIAKKLFCKIIKSSQLADLN